MGAAGLIPAGLENPL